MIKIIRTSNDILKYKDEWDSILEESSTYTPFQEFHYIQSACKLIEATKQFSLYIMCVFSDQNKRLIAVLPLVKDKDKCARFIIDYHTDYCDIITNDFFYNDIHLYEEISLFLQTDPEIQSIELNNLCSSSCLLSYLRYFLQNSFVYASNGVTRFIVSYNSCNEIINDIGRLNAKEKHRLKKDIIKKANIKHHQIYANGDERGWINVDFLVKYMVENKIRDKDYFDSSMLAFLKELYSKGLLNLIVTTENNDVLSASLYFPDNKGGVIQWIAFYKKKEYNLLNVWGLVERIWESGGGIFDFARGWYTYKIRNFRPQLENLYTFRYAKGYWGQIKNIASLNFYLLKQIAKQILRK